MLFWDIEEIEIEEKRKRRLIKNIYKGQFAPKLFMYMIPFTCTIFMYNIMKNFNTNLPTYVPQQYHLKFLPYLVKTSFLIYEIINVLFILAFDCVLIFTCVYLEAELDMIGYQMKVVLNNYTGKDKRKQLIDHIQYHSFILR